jgi:inhibitor of KinA
MIYEKPVFRPMGDRAVLVELGDEITPEVNDRVRDLLFALDQSPLQGIVDLVPAYASLLVVYDPLLARFRTVRDWIESILDRRMGPSDSCARLIKVPVVYGGDFGPDLQWVADFHGIPAEEVIRLHAGARYRVYMIGFMPGYAYMGELPVELATPRKHTPRTRVAAGSVGIAQRQTGIYPAESPGGWQIIGRTPIALFDPHTWPPATLGMGDMVQFHSIDPEVFSKWGQ